MDRRFPVHNGAQVITCAVPGCNASCETARNGGTRGGNLPPQAVARFFANKGWKVGQTARKDRCPEHAKPHRKEGHQMAERETVPRLVIPPKPGASEEPPREMTREHRRLIFLKLEETYIDEKVGYSSGWNDQKVAEDMAVPRAWVETIREENFGPQKAEQSEEIIALTASMERLGAEVVSLGEDAIRVRRAAAVLIANGEQAVKDALTIEKRSSELAARLTSLRDEVRKLTGAR